MNTQDGYQGTVRKVASMGDYNAIIRATPHIEDVLSDVVNAWTIDRKHANLVGGKIQFVFDRISNYGPNIATQGIAPPVYGYSRKLGVPVADFGNVPGHNKLLNCLGGDEIAAPFTVGAVFEQNVPLAPTDTCRIIGNALGATRNAEVFTDVPNKQWGMYNGGTGLVCPYYDWSYVGPIAMLCSFGQQIGDNSRIAIIRGDGRIWHTENVNITSGVGSGKVAWGGFGTAPTQGYPGSFADVFRMSRSFRQQDLALFIKYLLMRYSGFSEPANQVILDGDSLFDPANSWTSYIYETLPRAHWLACTGVSGRRLDEIENDLRLSFSNGTPGYSATNLVYAADGGTNDVIQNKTYNEIINAQQARIDRAKSLGANSIIVSSILPIGTATATQESVRKQVNNDLLSTWSMRGITKVVNLSTTEMIDGQQCPTQLLNPLDPAFFMPDGIHPTAAGYVYLSKQFETRINQVI